MSRLSLYLLGPPRIECDSKSIKVDTRKAIALLAYTAVTRESHRRDALVNLLWPESDQTHGRAALRSTLYALRKALVGDWLDVDRENVGLDPEADVWLDVDQFHLHLAECHTHDHPLSEICPACLAPLTAAVELYRDDFLSGFTLKDSFSFDDWQFFQADALRREVADALDRLVRCHIAQGAFELAIRYARRWLALDRLNEPAHCQLMLLYAWSGQRPAALRQYQECALVLESQLGVSPQASTAALHKAIAAGRAPEPPVEERAQRLQDRVEAGIRPQPVPVSSFEGEQPSVSVPTPALVSEAKRLVTVLLADMGGSLARGSDTSPEDAVALVNGLLGVMQDAAAKYGGQVKHTLGGSILAVFGATRTHESDPELAIRAAFEMRKEAGKLGTDVSIGIDTGEVYFREMAPDRGRGFTLVGRVVDLAIRLAGQAKVGQILVGESTYRLTRRAFEFTLCSLDIVGIDGPVYAYQVERLLPEPKKARGIEGLRAELIGRDEELARLKGALAQVFQGHGQIVTLVGEAGVGKSRLVAELGQVALAPGGDGPIPLWLEGRCLELGIAASYAPFIDVFRQYFAWDAREADRRRYERVTSSLEEMVQQGDLVPERAEEMAAVLGRLLSLPIREEWAARLANDDPGQIRWRTFLVVRDFVIGLCKQRPVVLVFEDLHWADSLSIDLISLLMEALPTAPLLLLCVYRPEREHRCWHLATIAAQKCRGRYTELRLHELTHRQSQQLVESLLRVEDLGAPVRALILTKAQGNPLFIEEVIHSLIDAGIVYLEEDIWRARKDVGLATIPESVQSVILSRVDRLEEGWKYVLQVASVIGRVFRRRVLERAIQQDADLEQALWALEDRALIYQERTVPEVEYSFKHVLTQETVYQSILRDRRKGFHRRVAEAIGALYSDNLDEHYEQLAHHHEKSGDVERAIEYLLKAGEKARGSHASEEAIAHLSRGLELLDAAPQMPERAQRELDLLIALGVPLIHVKGHAAPEVKRVYSQASELCRRIGDAPQRLQVLTGLRRSYFVRGALQTTYTLGEQFLATAQNVGDPLHLSWAHVLQGEVLYWLGEFSQSREHCERGLALCDALQSHSRILLYGNDAGIGCRVMGALAMWHLGYPDQALAMSREALDQARALSHPFVLTFALFFNGVLYQLRREPRAAREQAEAALRIAAERGFALYLAWGAILCGWALTELHLEPVLGQTQVEEGIDQMREGIAAWRATGAAVALPNSLASLAQAFGRVGRTNGALSLLDEALGLVDQNGERCWEAELYRLKGELLLIQGKETRAEKCLERAVEVAHRQRARSWELRAATSLGRLWHVQGAPGKRAKARRSLQEIYGWFTEGLDTADLKEAKALLDTLA